MMLRKYRAWYQGEVYQVDAICFADNIAELRMGYPSGDIWIGIEDLILEQYTGLKDTNGVEICQGDIVKSPYDFMWEDENGEYHYYDEYTVKHGAYDNDGMYEENVRGYGWYIIYENFKESIRSLNEESVEIIGNIHEGVKS